MSRKAKVLVLLSARGQQTSFLELCAISRYFLAQVSSRCTTYKASEITIVQTVDRVTNANGLESQLHRIPHPLSVPQPLRGGSMTAFKITKIVNCRKICGLQLGSSMLAPRNLDLIHIWTFILNHLTALGLHLAIVGVGIPNLC
jgi:hypothetical protein